MDISKHIEKLLESQDSTSDELLKEILIELKEIKLLLKKQNTTLKNNSYFKNQEYYDFINTLRKKLKANINKNIYPEIYYKDKILGIDNRGYLYDKKTTNNLTARDAFEVYKFLFKKRDNLEKYINNFS